MFGWDAKATVPVGDGVIPGDLYTGISGWVLTPVESRKRVDAGAAAITVRDPEKVYVNSPKRSITCVRHQSDTYTL